VPWGRFERPEAQRKPKEKRWNCPRGLAGSGSRHMFRCKDSLK